MASILNDQQAIIGNVVNNFDILNSKELIVNQLESYKLGGKCSTSKIKNYSLLRYIHKSKNDSITVLTNKF